MELREHRWVPRKAFLDNGPKTINQIRQDAVKVSTQNMELKATLSPFFLMYNKQFDWSCVDGFWIFSSVSP